MARRRRRSTRKGGRRTTARRAYYPKPRRRRYRARRGGVAMSRRRGGPAMLKAGTKDALMDIGYMVAGAATVQVLEKYAKDMLPFNSPAWTTAAILGGWGLYKNDKKMIYAGFGCVMDKIQEPIYNILP